MAADGFRNVPPDVMWLTSMLGYATLAIELEDLDAAALLLAIIEPYAGQIATNLGRAAAYAGRLASLLGRRDRRRLRLGLPPGRDLDGPSRGSPQVVRSNRRYGAGLARDGLGHLYRPGAAGHARRDRRTERVMRR